MSDPTSVVRLVDDDSSLRGGLAFALEMAGLAVVGYESAEALFERDDPRVPGCIVLDIRMGGMSGLECQRRLKSHGFDQPVIFLSGHGDVEMALQAVKQGAADFFTKPVSAERLAEACRRLFDWNVSARRERAERARAQGLVARLTPREKDVALAASTGAANKTIAKALGVSEQAVKIHRSNVYAKLEVHSAVEIRAVLERAGAAEKTDESRLGAVRTQLLPVEEES